MEAGSEFVKQTILKIQGLERRIEALEKKKVKKKKR